jgi:heptosyltransferase-2
VARAPVVAFPTTLVVDLPNWVGDTMMALPAVERLLAANQAGESWLHTRPAVAGLLGAFFPTARVVATERRSWPWHAARRLVGGRRRCRLGITLRNAWRAKLTLLAAAEYRLGSRGQGGGVLLDRAFATDRTCHQVHDADPILQHLGLASVAPGWRRPVPAALREEGRRVLAAAGLADHPRLVGLAPGSAGAAVKRWPSASFARLAAALTAAGAQPLVLVGPGEAALAGGIVAEAGCALPVVGLDRDVAGLAGIAAALDLVVGVDSGAVHVAAVVGTPVVALFGPTRPERTAPPGPGVTTLSTGRACAGCELRSCPVRAGGCMAEIPVDGVHAAVLAALDHRAGQLPPRPEP